MPPRAERRLSRRSRNRSESRLCGVFARGKAHPRANGRPDRSAERQAGYNNKEDE